MKREALENGRGGEGTLHEIRFTLHAAARVPSIWAMTEAEEPLLTALVNRVFLPEDQRDAAKAADGAERFKVPLAVLDGELAGKNYLVGKDFSVADLNVASVVGWAPMGGIDLSGAANVSAWLGRCTARPGYSKTLSLM